MTRNDTYRPRTGTSGWCILEFMNFAATSMVTVPVAVPEMLVRAVGSVPGGDLQTFVTQAVLDRLQADGLRDRRADRRPGAKAPGAGPGDDIRSS